ncbi:MAG: Hsp70 family protein [Chlamydiota bacterium]
MRYIVGIDLGTTNTTVAYVDTHKDLRFVQIFEIPQTVGEGRVAKCSTLPSFCYISSDGEFPSGALDLPWRKRQKYVIGSYALQYGSQVPTGLVTSAKSWLCYHTASQKEAVLPVDSKDDSMRISPIEATRRYLDHIRQAWNYSIAKGNPDDELEQQEIILTVPASFDEVARALTAEAAKNAGFEKITFLEEPQAAFYNWIAQHEKNWEENFQDGESILVCDVGGGTTDFSLIRYQKKDQVGSFERMAVGNHLLLGGDNIDLTLAYYLEEKLQKECHQEVAHEQWKRLYHEARNAKEHLLSGKEEYYNATIQGKGASVIEGSLSITLNRDEVIELLQNGFFPIKSWEEAKKLSKAKGLRSNGLPYEDDPCITKQLACFLNVNCKTEEELPSHLLFNGGTMMAPVFQEAIKNAFKLWFPKIPLNVLSVKNMEQAVSKGASYFGRVRRGEGVKIKAGSPRSFYLELNMAEKETTKKALCLLPRGIDEGTEDICPRDFSAIANSPVSFTLYASHTRLGDEIGDIISIDPSELHPLPPISTILRFGKKSPATEAKDIPVTIGISYTTLGTLELWLQSKITDHRWNLEFQLKSSSGQDDQLALIKEGRHDETFNANFLEEAKNVLFDLFTPGGTTKPEKIIEILEGIFEQPRLEWSPSILRGLWETLLEKVKSRKLSPKHEARWWNLAGLFLRPGFGYPLDDHRMKELWKVILSETNQKSSDEVSIQKWICLRRVSGGLNKGQQNQIYHQIMPSIFNKQSGRIELSKGCDKYHYKEKIRTLASLERVEFKAKRTLGKALIEAIIKAKGGSSDEIWAVGRIGAREPLYVSQANVLPVEDVSPWIQSLLPHSKGEKRALALAMLARKTPHNELNVKKEIREQVKNLTESTHLHKMIDGHETLTAQEKNSVLGDHLPPGIILRTQ